MAIYALIGQSASGKSTVERALEEMGYPRIISHTTRPMRQNEKQGVDYHFIDYLKFQSLESEDFFSETATYREWRYGLSLKGVSYEANDYIVVVTIHGYNELLKIVGRENIIGIHIHVPERERIIRQLKRGDEVDEVIRRIHTDRVDFAGVEDICDYIIDNNEINGTVDWIRSIIFTNTTRKQENM